MTTDERAAWLDWRRGGIGASDAAAVVGLSPYASRWSLWADKVGLTQSSEQTERQRIGQLLESAIAQLFTERSGLHVVGAQTTCEHPEFPWARCTVDGFVVESADSSINDAIGTFEIKTDGSLGWEHVPTHIRAQCVWQMAVTGRTHCWLAVLHGGFRFDVHEIDWDAAAVEDWQLLRLAADRFWHEHVLTGVPPEIDDSDATHRALLAAYPNHEPGTTASLDELRDVVELRAELTRERNLIDRQLSAARNVLLAAMGDAELGTIDGEPVLSARWHERAAYTVEASRSRQLRAATKRDRQETAA